MSPRRIAVLDAPSNLGLRPPEDGAVPGCYKAPWALRDAGLLAAVRGEDAGAVVPPRYRAEWDGRTVRNADAIAVYSRRLADRVGALLDEGAFPVVLGGDCSILLGNALALRRRGRYGLAFLDAHLDFRHPGNADAVGAAAGEDLALVTGRGAPGLTDLDGLRPYVRDDDVLALGIRPRDVWIGEAQAVGIEVVPAGEETPSLRRLERDGVDGFWIHLDVDVLDASAMPAADCPEPGGPGFDELGGLLARLLRLPGAAGLELTVFDPDLDPDGSLAGRLVALVENAFIPL